MKEISGYVSNDIIGIYVPTQGQEIYRLNAKNRLVKIHQWANSVTGYKMFEHRGRLWYTHQVIYQTLKPLEYHSGRVLKLDIDHRDNNKVNNQISNLRMLSRKDNCANKIKRGGRQVLAHNPTTFITRIFNSITDTARYINCSISTALVALNTEKEVRGWRLTTSSPTQSYVYIIDGSALKNTIEEVTQLVGLSPSTLYALFTSPEYGNKIDIKGFAIERIAKKQAELKTVIANQHNVDEIEFVYAE